MVNDYIRPFLKWPGRKYNILPLLNKYISEFSHHNTLVEPFVGSASVFLNTSYKRYYLTDVNPDLINLYLYLVKDSGKFIKKCQKYFVSENNNPEKYYELRDVFNSQTNQCAEKAAIFLYLNRHGYNGLCRYNNNGKYNVPFGDYKTVVLPINSMKFFSEKAGSKNVMIECQDFKDCFKKVKSNSLIYCDPPYIPLSTTASFTKYAKNDFQLSDQECLVQLVKEAAKNNCSSIISNHDLDITRELYCGSQIVSFDVQRNISCKVSNRGVVKEILAIYHC